MLSFPNQIFRKEFKILLNKFNLQSVLISPMPFGKGKNMWLIYLMKKIFMSIKFPLKLDQYI